MIYVRQTISTLSYTNSFSNLCNRLFISYSLPGIMKILIGVGLHFNYYRPVALRRTNSFDHISFLFCLTIVMKCLNFCMVWQKSNLESFSIHNNWTIFVGQTASTLFRSKSSNHYLVIFKSMLYLCFKPNFRFYLRITE